jgi:hypothetical protein
MYHTEHPVSSEKFQEVQEGSSMSDLSSVKVKRASKLSPSQRRVLTNLYQGLPAGHHLQGRSEHGGFNGTYTSLVRLGLIQGNCELTDAGVEVAKEID